MDRHARHLLKEMGHVGKLGRNMTHGLHFKFYDPTLGGFFLRNAKDPDAYRGIEYDWLLIDELTEFMRDEFDGLMYLLRSGDDLPFFAFGAATNPDGVGHGWVKKLWIEKDFEDEKGYKPEQFNFIPARAWDNPTFRPEIEAKLTSFKDEMLVKARWEGSWDIASGTRFRFERGVHVFSQKDFEQHYGDSYSMKELLNNEDLFQIYGSLDYGTDINAASAFHLHAVDWKGAIWTFAEMYMQGLFLSDQAEAIREFIKPYNVRRIYCDPSLLGKDSDGINRIAKFRARGVHMMPGINDRVEGWGSMDEGLYFRRNQATGELSPPKWRIHSDCKELILFLATAPRDELKKEDVAKNFARDHAGDGARYFIHSYMKAPVGKIVETPSYLKPSKKTRELGYEQF
jgi:phage terminase large subunit